MILQMRKVMYRVKQPAQELGFRFSIVQTHKIPLISCTPTLLSSQIMGASNDQKTPQSTSGNFQSTRPVGRVSMTQTTTCPSTSQAKGWLSCRSVSLTALSTFSVLWHTQPFHLNHHHRSTSTAHGSSSATPHLPRDSLSQSSEAITTHQTLSL